MMLSMLSAARATRNQLRNSNVSKCLRTVSVPDVGSRSASTLIVADPSEEAISASTLSAITAAQKLHSGPITILTTNPNTSPEAVNEVDTSKLPNGITKILLLVNSPDALAETISDAIVHATQEEESQGGEPFTHVLAMASKFGSNVLPRAAALLHQSSPITDVVEVLDESTFVRPMYAGNALAKVTTDQPLKLLTVRATSFEKPSPAAEALSPPPQILALEPDPEKRQTLAKHVSSNVSQSDRPDLSSATTVISGGRGLKSGENFALLESLADAIGDAAVGASRAAVDAGYVPNDLQVGQTGKVVAPDLYIAAGISGAIQHLSGMKDSKTIVAINNDPEAPIFQVADYGLVDDLFKVVPELTDKISS